MRRSKGSTQFLTLTMLSALVIVSVGLFMSFVNRSVLLDTLYQINQRLDFHVFLHIMDQEIPGDLIPAEEKKRPSVFEQIFRIQFREPKTFISETIPGMADYRTDPESGSGNQSNEGEGDGTHDEAEPSPQVWAEMKSNEILPDNVPSISPSLRNSRPVVFIYHTHNRESWYSEVKGSKSVGEAFHPQRNITLIGKHFGEALQAKGIPVQLDQTDHTGKLKEQGKSYSLSYAESLLTVKAAMSRIPKIEYILDFHRDSIDRENTTATINGKTYAKIMFVIGKHNPHWEENYAFAKKIKDILDEKYPGLSRPIVVKTKGHGEYNQTISPKALTVEIGGVGNTVEEAMRSAELLAEAFAQVYLDAVPVFEDEGGTGQ